MDELTTKADGGDAEAAFKVFEVFRDGIGVPVDLNRSLKYLESAAGNGHTEAMAYLGVFYLYGNEPNIPLGMKWLVKASDKGSLQAKERYGWIRALGTDGKPADPKVGRALLEEAAKGGNAQALMSLGELDEIGVGGPPDDAAAILRYKKAMELGLDIGACYYAKGLLTGKGAAKDPAKAFELSAPLAEKGNMHCQYNMGLYYRLGYAKEGNSKEGNAREAVKWLYEASRQGHGPAADNLGVLLFQAGQYDKAFIFMKIAALRGRGQALKNMAVLHEQGIGTKVDKVEAYRWARLCIDKADEEFATDCRKIAEFYEDKLSAEEREEAQRLILTTSIKGPFAPLDDYDVK